MRTSSKRRGIVLIYAITAMTVLLATAVLAVDYGRVQLAKTEAQGVADAAARYGASGLKNTLLGQSASASNALSIASLNTIDGQAVAAAECLTETGYWNAATKAFTPTADIGVANSVRVTISHCFGNGRNPLLFAPVFGSRNTTVRAVAIALVNGSSENFYAPAKGNLWLSGMPAGTVTQNLQPNQSWVWDTAGSASNQQSPSTITSSAVIAAGNSISFDGINGTATYDGGLAYGADGDSGYLVCHGSTASNYASVLAQPDNGIANVRAPIGSMIAIFMSDSVPTATAAPSPLDFTTTASRDFQILSPSLKQPFFIGNGRRQNGEVQQFVVPAGATRLFIGMMDAWQWNDNVGGFDVTGHVTVSINTVK